MKIITTGQFFLMNCQLSRFSNNQVNLYEFFLLGRKVQTKIRTELPQSFELTRFYCILIAVFIPQKPPAPHNGGYFLTQI
jgi:hypothetical protein